RNDHRGADGHRHQRVPPDRRRPLFSARSQSWNTGVYMKRAIAAGLLVAFVVSGCNVSEPAKSAKDNGWDPYVDHYLSDYFAANPQFAAYQGKHEYDGRFSDWSDAGLRKEIERLKAEREKAAAFKDADLDDRQHFERDYLIAAIDNNLFWRETADQPHTNPYWYSDAVDPDMYVSRPYAPLDVRLKAYTVYARNLPAALAQIKANMRPPMAMNLIKIGRQTIGGLADFMSKDVVKVFVGVKDDALQKDFKNANDGAIKAVKDFDAALASMEKTANNNFALGLDKFKAMLKQTEAVDIDLTHLEDIGK